jgi:hypothetical protein
MTTTITGLLGSVGLAVSVALVWWQTRVMTKQTGTLYRQTEIANSATGVQVHDAAVGSLRTVLLQFTRRPGLRPYFYERKPCPARGGRRRAVLSLAEVFADVLETGLAAQQWAPDTGTLINWHTYCQYLLSKSPTLRDVVRQWPGWWPGLDQLERADNGEPAAASGAPSHGNGHP